MSHKKKISVVVFGNEESLKKSLITIISGKELSRLSKRNALKKTEIYEDDTFQFTCTPDLNADREDIKNILEINRYPDMFLLVVEDGFSAENVWQEIEKLHKTSGIPTEKFRVVLPLSDKQTDFYPFRFYTIEQLFSELRQLAEERNLNNERNADHLVADAKGKHSGSKVNLVLLGMSGTGKSASGNTILGKKEFESRADSKTVTKECQVAETEINGTHVRVIDTPDIFDDDIESSVKNKHVTMCKELCQSEPCVYLLVMHVSRFTDCERDILKKLKEAFGSKVQEKTVILFTRGDDLKSDNMSLEDFLHDCQADLKNLVKQCDDRCVLFENGASDPRQVEELMQTVDRMIKQNNCACIRADGIGCHYFVYR